MLFAMGDLSGVTFAGTIEWTDFDANESFTVVSLHCEGCTVTDDPTGTSVTGAATFHYVPTTDGTITITAQLQWDPTGDETSASETLQGDREVRVDASCYVVNAADVDLVHGTLQNVSQCGSSRSGDELVALFPVIDTEHGAVLMPGAPIPEAPASSSFQFAPGSYTWFTNAVVLDNLGSVTQVTVTAKLPTGETVAAAVNVPPIAAP
jgi:hypothetical protein